MSDWQTLSEEFDLWSDSGSVLTFWWRDDDAVAPSPQLERLLNVANSVPLALAVVPQLATRKLSERVRTLPSVVVLQHGYAHQNRSTMGLSEYPASRAEAEVGQELASGKRLLGELFGKQSLPVFVPPYHAFDDRFLPLLPQNGIAWISRKGPRAARFASNGLLQVNTHVSPIRWTTPPTLGDEAQHLWEIVDHLRGRRTGRYDPAEPTGLLTHHLWQDQESYEFVSRLISVTLQYPRVKWLHGGEVFANEKVYQS